eukprot:CAMPEP_0183431546 /NCGR_PEP_ID=MMETSP0370-20130417/54891_1 /TAXON_ID=268820 /ORGANISM="Peridinium aciculiferum, Strain PAER-2" /LENGTH=276 /DNA_ID=CAMNT_0025617269 /DNA_START=87 /DNA_END=917 /DNA_ORIENTATION=+
MAPRGLKALTFAACALSAAEAGQVQLRHSAHKAAPTGFVTSLEFKHQLRVCNAYPNTVPMDIYRGASERLTGGSPLRYKDCRDFQAPLMAGDKLEFKMGGSDAGTFSISDLPNNDAVLLLVIHRHDALSTAVAFQSHVFAGLASAQVAVIDTYKGKEHSVVKIMDLSLKKKGGKAEPVRSEELRYSSVVAVNSGEYEVVLHNDSGAERVRTKLVALPLESYVVMRTGVESMSGNSFPQELVVYPNFDPSSLHSAAARPLASLAAVVFAAFGAVLAC